MSKIEEVKQSGWNTRSKEFSVILDRSQQRRSSEDEIEGDSDVVEEQTEAEEHLPVPETDVDKHWANVVLVNSSRKEKERIEEAEDCKSIWISDLEEPEEMSRRPQVLRIIDSDVTKRNRRSVTENDVVPVENSLSSSKVIDEVDGKVVGSISIFESENSESRTMTKQIEEDLENAENVLQKKDHEETDGSSSKRNEGKLERIIKETSSILGKACSAVKGSLGFEARSESSDLGLGSDSGSESRRRSVDDGVDVVDEASLKCADKSSVNDDANDNDNDDKEKNRTILTRSRSCVDSIERQDRPEFDHIRYKIVKSDMFSKGMFGSTKRDASFDGLMQYLQEYSFQELLVDNNVVIIEPVRAETIERKSPNLATNDRNQGAVGSTKTSCKIAGAIEKKQRLQQDAHVVEDAPRSPKQSSSLRRHFFYHPIRVNRELIDEELPDPDTVRNVRRMFEGTLKLKSPCSEVARGSSCKKSTSMKDLSRIDDRDGSSRCSSRARDLTRLFENMEKLSVAGGRDELESPARSESKTRTLAQSFEAKSGHTSPSDSALLKGKVSRYLNSWDAGSVSSGVSSDYPDTDPGSGAQCISSSEDEVDYHQEDEEEEEEDYDDEDLDAELTGHSVSQDVLKKIRECGTSVTYYGGKIVNSSNGPLISPMVSGSRSLRKILRNDPKRSKDLVKFRLVKSNSCDSRLELTGRLPLQVAEMKKKFHGGNDCERRPDLRDSPIMETPSIEITTIDRLEECEIESTVKREPPVVIGLEPKREENKDPEVFRTDFKLGRLEDCKSYANKFEDRWQVNEIGAGTKSEFGKMEFEEFEVLDDSLNVTGGDRC